MTTQPISANDTLQSSYVFGQQQILHTLTRDHEAERRALTYLDKHAPDLVGMILGGVL